LLQRILAAARSPGATVVAVTGPAGERAKTSMAIALARTAARANLRVAIVDGDLQRPATASAMGLGQAPFGVIEMLRGKASLSRTLRKDPRSKALLLSAALPVRDASRVLASAKMAQLMGHLRRTCDVVIVDAPALAAFGEARMVAGLSDVVLVVGGTGPMGSPANLAAVQGFAASSPAPVGWVVAR
jgi:Mrp family chromosome partitioning ATPase